MELYNNLTLYQAFRNAAIKTPNNTAIYYFSTKITFERLSSLIDRWAAILQHDLDVQKGDSVIISLPNIPQTIILFYAVNKIGAIANMVHPHTPKEKMQEYYSEANSKVAFLSDKKVYRELKDYKTFNGNIVICDVQTFFKSKLVKKMVDIANRGIHNALSTNTKFTFYRKYKPNKELAIENPIFDNETSVLLHSASTTGDSKTIMVSGRSFNYSASRACEMLCMNEEELLNKTMVSILPSFHGFGLCVTMHLPLANSFAVALVPKFRPNSVVDMMNKCKNVVCICGVPLVFKALLNYGGFINNKYLKNLGSCFSGGDALPSMIKENFDSLMVRRGSNCRLFEGYGLTEALSVSAVNTHRHHKYGSVGYPIHGVEFKILDDNNKEVERNTLGEICIKSNINMLGYFNDPIASKQAYFDGFLKTGDIGYMDEDDFIYYASRKKRVIKVSGVAVFPSEVEDVIFHIPGVKGCCAIQIPDENLTNAVKVFVISDNRDEDRIKNECRKHLMIWAVPKEVEFVNKLPYTKYKKVNFQKLQKEEDEKRS